MLAGSAFCRYGIFGFHLALGSHSGDGLSENDVVAGVGHGIRIYPTLYQAICAFLCVVLPWQKRPLICVLY